MQCTKPMLIKGQRLPCGKCISCRMSKSREWYVRLYHEHVYSPSAIFATFTYGDDHLPDPPFLNKRDPQLMFKSLRIGLDRPIKYYLCGEYGDETLRPHYHAIIFGLSINDHSVRKYYNQKTHKWTSVATDGPLFSSWKKGNVILGTVTHDSIKYVTDYIFKKLYGDPAKADPKPQPFSICSQGLGKQWALDNRDYVSQHLSLTIHGVKMTLPRYYVNILNLQEEMTYAALTNDIVKNVEYFNKHGNTSMPLLRGREQRNKNLVALSNLHKKGNL